MDPTMTFILEVIILEVIILAAVALIPLGQIPTKGFFNVQGPPPTAKDIATERRATDKESKYRRIKLALFAATLLSTAAMALMHGIDEGFFVYHIITYIIAAANTGTAILIVVFIFSDDEIGKIAQHRLSLAPMKQRDCPKMLALCRRHDKIRLYQNAVAAMGRPLTQGEYQEAVRAAVLMDEQTACAALSGQVPSAAPN